MTLEEIQKAINTLSEEEKGTIFTGLGKDMETLPKDLEKKFLDRKNTKLADKDKEIETLTTQVSDLQGKLKPYQLSEDEKTKNKLKDDIGEYFGKIENNNPSMKGTFTREIINMKSKDENKDKDIAALATEYLKTHNGFTVKSEIKELDDDGEKNTQEPKSMQEMIAQAKKNKN